MAETLTEQLAIEVHLRSFVQAEADRIKSDVARLAADTAKIVSAPGPALQQSLQKHVATANNLTQFTVEPLAPNPGLAKVYAEATAKAEALHSVVSKVTTDLAAQSAVLKDTAGAPALVQEAAAANELGAAMRESNAAMREHEELIRAQRAREQSLGRVDESILRLREERELLSLTDRDREQFLVLLAAERTARQGGARATDEQLSALLRETIALQDATAAKKAQTDAEVRSNAARAAARNADDQIDAQVSALVRQREALEQTDAERERSMVLERAEATARAGGIQLTEQQRTALLSALEARQRLQAELQSEAELEAVVARETARNIALRDAEAVAAKQAGVDIETLVQSLRDERAMLGLTANERELEILTRRAEQIAIKGGIADREKLIALVRQEGRALQEARAQTGTRGGRGLASVAGLASAIPGGGELSQVVFQAQQGATALGGMAEAAGASSAALGPIAVAGAGIAVTAIALGDAAKNSAALDEALRPVAARSDELAGRLRSLKGEVREISAETGRSDRELAAGLSEVVASGISNADRAVEFLRTATNLARATGEAVPTAVGALDSVLDAFNVKGTEAAAVADKLLVGAREGETTFPRFAAAMQKAGTVTSDLGIPLEETAAFLATVTKRTGNADNAAGALVNVLGKLTGATDPTRQRLLALGVDASAAAVRTKGLVAVIDEVRQKVGDRKDILADLFGSVRVASTFFAAVSDADGAARSLDAITKSAGEVEAAGKRAATAGEEFAKAWAQLRQRSGIDDLGDGLVRLGGNIARFTSDFLRDHETLTNIILSVSGPLGLIALNERLRNAPTALDRAAQAINALGKADPGTGAFKGADAALGAYISTVDQARRRIAELRAEQERLSQQPEGLVRGAGRAGGEPVFLPRRRELLSDQQDELKRLEEFTRTAAEKLQSKLQPLIGQQLLVPVGAVTQWKEFVGVIEDADGIVRNVWKNIVAGPPAPTAIEVTPEVSFEPNRLERELKRTLAELEATVQPLDIPARIIVAKERLQKTLASPELLKFASPDKDTAAAQEEIQALTQTRNQGDQLHLELQARAARGLDQQRLQTEIANAAIARTILLLGVEGFNVDRLRTDFVALKQSQDDAFDASKIRQAAQAAAQLAGSIAEVLQSRQGLAQASGDAVESDRVGLQLEDARADSIRKAAGARIADLRAAAQTDADVRANLDALIAGEKERADLAIRTATVSRERNDFEKQRAGVLLLAQAQRGLLTGIEAEIADIRLAHAERINALDDEIRKNAALVPLRAEIVRLYAKDAAQREKQAIRGAELDSARELLNLASASARSLEDQALIEQQLARIEDERVTTSLLNQHVTEQHLATYRELFKLAQQQRALDAAARAAAFSPSDAAESRLRQRALDKTRSELPNSDQTDPAFVGRLAENLLAARSGADALRDGVLAGVEDMRRAFADDLTFGIQAATDQMRTFRDSGVAAFEDVLDGNKKLSDGLNDFLIANLKQARHSALEFGFNKLGSAIFGQPTVQKDGTAGGSGGLFGGILDKVLGNKGDPKANPFTEPAQLMIGATDSFGRYVDQFGLYIGGASAGGAGVIPGGVGPPIPTAIVGPDFVGPLAPGQSQVPDDVARAASQTLEDGARAAGAELGRGAITGANAIQNAGFSFLQSIGSSIGKSFSDSIIGALASGATGGGQAGVTTRAQGGLERGRGPRYQDAASGTVARSEQYYRVAEVPGLEELIAPLDRGKLPAHSDEFGNLTVRVRGAQVPVDVRGGARGRGERAVDTRGLRAREDSAPARRGDDRQRSSGGVSIAPGAVVVHGGDVNIVVHAKGGEDVVRQIRSQMPEIAKGLAADLHRGATSVLKEAVKAAAR